MRKKTPLKCTSTSASKSASVTSANGAARCHAAVVDEEVERVAVPVSQDVADGGRERVERARVADVELQGGGAAAERLDLGDHGGGLVGVGAVGEDRRRRRRGRACSAVLRPMPRLPPVMRAMRGGVMPLTVPPPRAARTAVAVARDKPSLVAARAASHTRCMDRDGLADFLRRRREALQPEDVGLGPGRRRRTAGLRREEVAALAHMSTDFYARLEQRRGSRPSEQTVAALARALRLTQDERDHLFQLAGHVAPPRGYRTDHVSPALMRVLDRLDTPAQVVSDLGVVLRAEPARRGAAGRADQLPGLARSVFYRWFTDPARARALARGRPRRCTRAATPRRCAPPTAAIRRPRGARARRRAAAPQPGVRARCGSATRSAVRADTRKRIDAPAVGADRARLPDPHRREPDRSGSSSSPPRRAPRTPSASRCSP